MCSENKIKTSLSSLPNIMYKLSLVSACWIYKLNVGHTQCAVLKSSQVLQSYVKVESPIEIYLFDEDLQRNNNEDSDIYCFFVCLFF